MATRQAASVQLAHPRLVDKQAVDRMSLAAQLVG
jgi:hypothetical protein